MNEWMNEVKKNQERIMTKRKDKWNQKSINIEIRENNKWNQTKDILAKIFKNKTLNLNDWNKKKTIICKERRQKELKKSKERNSSKEIRQIIWTTEIRRMKS